MSVERMDVLRGVLRDGDFSCKCTVKLLTTLTAGQAGNAVRTRLEIASVEQTPPDGLYRLNVLGRIFKVRYESGVWPTLHL